MERAALLGPPLQAPLALSTPKGNGKDCVEIKTHSLLLMFN